MVNSIRCRITYVNPQVDYVLCFFVVFLLSFAAAPAFAQQTPAQRQLPSNVYRPPADTFQGSPQVTYPQGTIYQQGQTYQTVPQYRTVPNTQQYYYPQQQNQTPIYQQPIQEVQGQLVPQQVPTAPAANPSEIAELKSSLVKARDLMQKYQLKLEEVAGRNQELESEIASLKEAGDMSDSGNSQELAAAQAAAAEAKQQMSGLNTQLQNTLRELQTSTADLQRQKQMGAELQQQIAELQQSAKMAAGSDEQVAELTKNIQLFKTQNDELNTKVTDLQNAVQRKETQIASMGSGDDAQLADLKELLKESETSNKELNTINRELSLKLKDAEAAASEMSTPQENPDLDKLRADNQQLDQKIQQLGQEKQQLGQEKQQLQSENSQLNDMLGKLRSENSELDATVTRLSNMPPPQEATGFAAAAPTTAAPSGELTGLRSQLASLTRRNGQLERQLKKSKSKYSSLADDNARLLKDADSKPSIDVAAAPVAVAPVKADVAPVSVAVPELGLGSVSAGWPVKYWIFAMLGVGLLVGLGVAWYESVVDPKGLRRTTNSVSNQ